MNEFMFYAPLAAFLAVIILIPLACRLALVAGFVDEPGGRKQHDHPIPPIGGLVIFPVFMICGWLGGMSMDVYWPLFLGICILLVVGVLDDWLHLHPWVKFTSQIGVAFLVVLCGQARLYELGDLFGFGPLGLGFMSVPFSVAAVALLINAINLMDGLDGLAGGIGYAVFFWLTVAAAVAGDAQAVMIMAPMMAALAGFLVYNMRHPWRAKASVFMGDAGSMSLGLVLAWFCIDLAQQPTPSLTPISVAWILALPIIDTCGQFYRRAREGKHPFSPDRGHFHHHFIHAGISVRESVFSILGLALLLGGIGYVGPLVGVPLVVLTIFWIALLFTHMGLGREPERYIRILKKFGALDQESR